MSDKTIPLRAVRDALMLAVVRQRSQRLERPARWAAYTRAPNVMRACDGRLTAPASTFSLMYRGDLLRAVERTHMERGRQEVRRTWGAGLRCLQAELREGTLR